MSPLPTDLGLPAPLRQVLAELGVPATDARLSLVSGGQAESYLVLPSPDRPQLLVPITAAGGELVAERRSGGAAGRTVKRVLAGALRRGYAGYLPGPRLLVRGDQLSRWADFASAGACRSAGFMWGPPRANRKPVLRLFDGDGSTWGYAKVGINDLTNELVDAEAVRLARVNALTWRTLRPPKVLLDDTLDGRRVLTTAPLAGAGAERQPAALPVAATRELSSQLPTSEATLAEILVGPPAKNPAAKDPASNDRVGSLTQRAIDRWGDRILPVGASHGDWTPWNMAYSTDIIDGERVLDVWDWERFEDGRPLGFDIVHFACSAIDAARSDAADPQSPAIRGLRDQFAACGLDASLVDPVLAAYLLLITQRYDADLVREPVPSLSRRRQWALDLLDGHLQHTITEERS
jgi:hypothetical protein